MTGPARRILLSGWSLALLVGAAVFGNAVFLQQARHPAPLFATRADSAAAEARIDQALVTEIQRQLQARGLYRGEIDGIAGAETRLAIRTFERERGLPDRGEATDGFLATLVTSPDVSLEKSAPRAASEQTEPHAEAHAEPDPRLAEVQAALSRAAYGPVNADGLFGPQTRDAIMRFQLDEGLPVTGKIDETLVDRLKAIGALGA